MISEVVMPQMGADMKEGTVLRWLKAEGDQVERGEPIAEIETDKANIEIEAFEPGVFRKVLVPEGETIPVGTVIAVIAAAGDDISAYEGDARPTQTSPASGGAPAPAPTARPASTVEAGSAPNSPAQVRVDGRLRASPVARRLAQETGVDLSLVHGTGPQGRILRRDIEAAKSVAPAAPPPAAAMPAAPAAGAGPGVTTVALSRIRLATARRMAQSKREAPHYYLTLDVDMTEALRFRAQINAAVGEGGRVSINDLLILATTRTLTKHPRFNSWWLDDQLQLHAQINLGIAIALEDGLVAPAILDCASKPLGQISAEARDLSERARGNGALRPEEYTAGTFTITNLGAYGVDGLIGIINPPQTAILGVGAVRERAVVRDGQVVVRSMVTLALSADHRATDGAEGARFLQTLQQYLESPALLLV